MSRAGFIITAHQPVYLPWLGLLHKIALADAFVFFDDVQYQDKDWNNRNRVKTSAGPVYLTVPVFNTNHYTIKLKDVLIRNDLPWKRKHWKTLQLAYAKAPYAGRYLPFFEDLYRQEWQKLSDLNEAILKFLLDALGIRASFSKLSDMNLTSKKSQLVLEMCQRMQASLYLFGAQGRDYADEVAFREASIRLEFQDYTHPTYTQLHGPFVSHLSAVDLLFNHGPASLEILMSGNLSRQQLLEKHFAFA
ncbi:MAG: WbqC family protein [Candidatus Omnitrophota bacterium]|nr:WbqC family protein [Candidatus Omnitrophota bacterium]